MMLILFAIVALASTNLDDLFVLLMLFSDPALRPAEVVAGQYIGMTLLTLIALLGSLAAFVIPGTYVGLLGSLLLAIGVGRLRRRPRGPGGPETVRDTSAWNRRLAVAAITTANEGDNIAVYVPLLAGKSWVQVAVVIVVFGIMTAVWCAVAQVVIAHPRSGPLIKHDGNLLPPWIYMGLGASILVGSRAYTLIGLG